LSNALGRLSLPKPPRGAGAAECTILKWKKSAPHLGASTPTPFFAKSNTAASWASQAMGYLFVRSTITLQSIKRFSKFFHCYTVTQRKICYKNDHYIFHHTLKTLSHYLVKPSYFKNTFLKEIYADLLTEYFSFGYIFILDTPTFDVNKSRQIWHSIKI